MNNVTIDGVEYAPVSTASNVRIVVLQRGWIVVGRWSRDGNLCKLTNASVIRTWGTTKGLGELVGGPTASTKLDPCNGVVEYNALTEVLNISCDEAQWKKYLG